MLFYIINFLCICILLIVILCVVIQQEYFHPKAANQLTQDYRDSLAALCVDAAGDMNCDNNYVRSVRLQVLIG